MSIRTILKKYLPAFASLALIVLIVAGFWFAGYLSEKSFNAGIDNLSNNSQTHVREAANAQNAAVNSEVERRTEDAVREKVITPKLGDARQNSNNSKTTLEKAKRTYSDEQITHKNISSSVIDNCLKLRELYPNTRFDYCAESDSANPLNR